MPTSAKLVAAVWFALMGWLAANAHIPALGESASFGRFREITALIGLICGWRILGGQVGKGYADSIGTGLKTSIVLAFFAVLGFSAYQMVGEAMRMHYDGPMGAMLGWVELMMANAKNMATVGVLGVLIFAGVVGGPLAEWTWRRWK
ncbi:TrgA family protein [Pseudogemmobacter humi]|uniref:Tellurium resistance protein n=1 Tax=Pseudogemmobacter humi TaxID=2483812 RepID=A0A3P5X7R3_9RHOB|nr:TrgA family protein [Pseudogemmobacter humi]VDC30692.1 hypothetical protein XINFAN_02642 [Pseudogemmobacter humi]